MDIKDRSPEKLDWLNTSFIESKVKPLIRRPVYKILSSINHILLSSKYRKETNFEVDKFSLGQRGNDYAVLRRKANSINSIKGKSIFIAGCGTGRDIPSWLNYNPQKITAVDYFNYQESWDFLKKMFKQKWPNTKVEFLQADLENLSQFRPESYDFISSDAVLEHTKNLEKVLNEFYKILKKDGLLYSTFGPIWSGYHGDHFSGWDEIENGYNHLLLDKESYIKYVESREYFGHSEDDGRTWIENNLFSYLRPSDYIHLLEKTNFKKIFTKVLIEPNALKCLKKRSDIKEKLLNQYLLMDLLITGMSIFFKKSNKT